MFGRQTGWKAAGGGSGGGESLAQTLVLGNVTGGNNLFVTGGDYIRFGNGTNANYVGITGGVTTSTYNLTLPLAQGVANSFLMNNGSGVLSWSTVAPGDESLEETLAIGNYTGAYDILISATKKIRFDNSDETAQGILQCGTIDGARTWSLPNKSGTLAILSGLTTGVIPKASSATDLADGSWAFNANTLYPVTTGSDLGDSTHRISTIYMSSTINYGATSDLNFSENGTSRMIIKGTSGNVGIGLTPNASYKLEVGGDISINNPSGKLSWYDAAGSAYRTLIQMSQNIGAANIMVGGGFVTDSGNGGGISIGANSTTDGSGISIGLNATGFDDSIVIGRNATATTVYRCVAIGRGAISSASNAWAIGWNAVASQANTFIFGDSTDNNIKSGFGTNTPTSRLHVKTALGGSGFRVETNGSTTPVIYTNDSGQTGFGTASPNSSAIVDITSTTQGFLPPRMTEAQKNAISTPATGLLVYQTDGTNGFYYYDGASWIQL